MADPAFDSADYELLWPRELFIRELTAMSTIIYQHNHPNLWIECLLDEVFLGDAPVRDYKNSGTLRGCYYIDALLAYAPQLREHHVLVGTARRCGERPPSQPGPAARRLRPIDLVPASPRLP